MILELLLAAATIAPAEPAATACGQLKSLPLQRISITSSELVPEGAATSGRGGTAGGGGARGGAPGRGAAPAQPLPAYCRIVAVLTPSSDSKINVEVWLPTAEKWNGKFEAVGNGGWAGSIQGFANMQTALRAGYATAGGDTGHSSADGANGAFALGHPEKVVDFGYRAIHEMAVQSKEFIKTFYGMSEKLSYFNGCSTGGRQALMAAQKYPEDFDGILAGAPANNQVYLHAADMTRMMDIYENPAGFLTQAKQNTLAQAVMNSCDALDGVKDNLVSNPLACKFDPAVLLCKNGDSDSCLTAPQVETARRIHVAAKTAAGELVFPGYSYGGETGYNVVKGGTVPGALQMDTFKYLGHQDPNWDWHTFDLDKDIALANKNAGFINATETDLSKFKARGGKLLMYHGWADPAIPAENSVNYYERVLARMGKDQGDWMRLFMVPGMGHCSGGAGPNQVDWFGTLEKWREEKVTPVTITGSNAAQGMTRPLCPHPQVATYKGAGDPNAAASFECKAP